MDCTRGKIECSRNFLSRDSRTAKAGKQGRDGTRPLHKEEGLVKLHTKGNSVEFQWLIAVKLLFSPFFNCKHVHVTMTATERLEQLSKQLSPGSQQIQMLHTPDMTSEEACKK